MTADLYVISSQGRTATTWLSVALNLHPDIACAHGSEFPLAIRDAEHIAQRDSKKVSYAPDGGRVDPGRLDREKIARDEGAWGLAGARLGNASLTSIIADARRQTSVKAIALVHVISAYELRYRIKFEGFAGTIRRVNLVRHPITRVASYAAHFKEAWQGYGSFTNWILGFRNTEMGRTWIDRCRQMGADPDMSEDLLWIVALCWIENDFNDLEMDIPHIPYERVVGDPDYFYWFLRQVFGRDIDFPPAYLDQVRNLRSVNVTAQRRSAPEIFWNWKSWQRNAFELFLIEHRLRQRYRPFQYELDFVLDHHAKFV
jgi:hypothetical protein